MLQKLDFQKESHKYARKPQEEMGRVTQHQPNGLKG